MAKVKDPFGAREARGSVGGITASRNTMGQYLRCKASPVQPRTNTQQAQRYLFQRMVREFQDLTAAQIQAWADFASANPILDVFGDSISVTGLNWYVTLNSRLAAIGVASNSTPPLGPNSDYVPILGAQQNTTTSGDIELTFDTVPTGNERIWVYYGGNQPFSSLFAKKDIRLRTKLDSTATSPTSIISYADLVPDVSLRQIIAFVVDTAGRATPRQRFTVYPQTYP